jgi:probable F420-dependent oxidoreductase
MRIGVVFPQTEFPSDAPAIRDYAQAVEGMGFTHILAYDHVLGANPDRPGGWKGPYTYKNPFQEVFMMFAYMAGITQRIEFTTGILILPQRQTALVAKQAAQLDVLSGGGRFRMGVGNGWNEVEYTALNEDFHTRGKHMEEQIEVLRLLWKQSLVTFEGQWHHIPDAGIDPRPLHGNLPIWFGGSDDRVLERMARLGEGWMTNHRKPEDAQPVIEKLTSYLQQKGRSWGSDFGMEPRINFSMTTPDDWSILMQDWAALGATHISINTMGADFTSPQQHLDALRQFADVVGVKASS